MADGTNNAIKGARPVVQVDGSDNDSLTGGLLGLDIVETVSGLYRCEALFGNWGPSGGSTSFLYFDRKLLDFGKSFAITLDGTKLFDGRIGALEGRFPEGGPPQIGVLAEDRLQDLRMTRRTRSFADQSDADVMQAIAGEHGLQADVSVSGPSHKILAQVNQSDLAFLRDRARAIDAELWVEGTSLKVRPHSGRNAGSLTLAVGGQLREFSVLADLANQRTKLVASGWDVAGKSALTHESSDAAISSEVGSDDSGVSILKSKLGDRAETFAHGVPIDSAEVQAQADAVFRAMARRFVVGRGVVDGGSSAKMKVGVQVTLQSVGPLFEGKYYVTEVRHRFDASKGLRSEFRCERPGVGKP
jgi:phage protein D